ncbi:MAG: lipopolysaccharide kinase InaA family protein [Paludibacteraceae bacterium]|nr:lipopolysaccharide kinase InaA family protein [Paludibacteraceae bacterium]
MKVVINDEYKDYRGLVDFIENLDSKYSTNGTTMYLARNEVKSFYVEELDREIVIKKYKKPILVQRFVYSFFRKSKAERAYLNAKRLVEMGIGTPNPIAYVEQKNYGMMETCYFACEKTTQNSIQPIMLLERPLEPSLAMSLAGFFIKLHTNGVLHNDLNAGNILYCQDDEKNYHFSLIDNNRMDFVDGEIPFEKRMENICKFSNEEIYKQVVACYAEMLGMESKSAVETAIEARTKWLGNRNKRKNFLAKFKKVQPR